jgi:acylphosphatase
MSEGNLSRLHAFLHGRVQGVGFRHFVMTHAGDLGLTGWVRNLRDGRVEVTAEGPRPRLEDLLGKLHRGPVSADVRRVDENWGEHRGEFSGFKVKRTQ